MTSLYYSVVSDVFKKCLRNIKIWKQYETLVLEHLSNTSLDYGICKLSRGIIDMMEGKPEPAEINLLGAESIIGNAVGTNNDYMKTTYRYLNSLYTRWKKPEKRTQAINSLSSQELCPRMWGKPHFISRIWCLYLSDWLAFLSALTATIILDFFAFYYSSGRYSSSRYRRIRCKSGTKTDISRIFVL